MCIAASVQITYCHFQAPTLGDPLAYQIKLIFGPECESDYECNRTPELMFCRLYRARKRIPPELSFTTFRAMFLMCSAVLVHVCNACLSSRSFSSPQSRVLPVCCFQSIPGIKEDLCLSGFEEPWARCSPNPVNWWSPALLTTTSEAWCGVSPRKGCVGLRFDVVVLTRLCSFA